MRWIRRRLIWILTANLGILGVVILVAYDSNLFLGWDRMHRYQAAYNRWRNIRDNWDKYADERRKRDEFLKKSSLQLDEIVSFNEIHKDESRAPVRDLTYYVMGPLDFVPPVPPSSDSDIVPSLTDKVARPFLRLPRLKYSNKIAILTPICNLEGSLERYAQLLNKLSYPHKLISVYFGEDSSYDRTFDMATLVAADLKEKHGFNDSAAFHFNITGGVHGSWGDVHYRTSQLRRRSHLAKARNMLLNVGLHGGEFDYVLWIDGDISDLPADLVQQLLSAKSDVVAPSCLYKTEGYKKIFDKNSWRETPTSLNDQKGLSKDTLIVEGYTHTYRIFLSHLRGEGRVVPLDGVGGCALLVKSECHRNGLEFPEKVYRNHIETEGLAKMAKDMKYSVVGMPFVEVFH